jgi:hypothetical protein
MDFIEALNLLRGRWSGARSKRVDEEGDGERKGEEALS